mmetsp:Transcript_11989/g.19516  ORF Transcript_11989/g.19516 Transcript_11989/m.19516 type:complete len:149 (-) Transcript_11989:652-1098(-)
MVGCEYDDGVVVDPALLQLMYDATEIVIYGFDGADVVPAVFPGERLILLTGVLCMRWYLIRKIRAKYDRSIFIYIRTRSSPSQTAVYERGSVLTRCNFGRLSKKELVTSLVCSAWTMTYFRCGFRNPTIINSALVLKSCSLIVCTACW